MLKFKELASCETRIRSTPLVLESLIPALCTRPYFLVLYPELRGFPRGSVVKMQPAMQEKWVSSLGQEDSLSGGSSNLLQYSCLGNSMDRGAWWATVHGVTEELNTLSD